MNLRAYRTFQALILAGLGIFLFSKVMDGHILLYINRRFVILVLLAAVALILMAQFVLRERPSLPREETENRQPDDSHADARHDGRSGWTFWLLALPVLIGVLAPERPLGAGVLNTRGIQTGATYIMQGGSTGALEIPSTQRSVLDWIRVVSEASGPAEIEGRPADVTGFVYHDARLGPDQFMISRFSIACCVADATAIGMVVNWSEAASLPDNQWVRVRGPVRLIRLEGGTLASIDAISVEPIPEPEQPYLFP